MEYFFGAQYLYFDEMETHYLISEALEKPVSVYIPAAIWVNRYSFRKLRCIMYKKKGEIET